MEPHEVQMIRNILEEHGIFPSEKLVDALYKVVYDSRQEKIDSYADAIKGWRRSFVESLEDLITKYKLEE